MKHFTDQREFVLHVPCIKMDRSGNSHTAEVIFFFFFFFFFFKFFPFFLFFFFIMKFIQTVEVESFKV